MPSATPHPAQQSPEGRLRGIAASEGVAVGTVFAHFPPGDQGRTAQACGGRNRRGDREAPRRRGAGAVSAWRRRWPKRRLRKATGHRRSAERHRRRRSPDRRVRKAGSGRTSTPSPPSSARPRPPLPNSTPSTTAICNARADDIHAVGRQLCAGPARRRRSGSLDTSPQGAILIADDIGAWDLARAPLKRIGGSGLRPGRRHVAYRDHRPLARHSRGAGSWRAGPRSGQRQGDRNRRRRRLGRRRSRRRDPRRDRCAWRQTPARKTQS